MGPLDTDVFARAASDTVAAYLLIEDIIMEQTSWISDILTNPFLRGLCIGLAIAVVFWVRGWMKARELNGNLKKLREHLHTKLEIDSAENERRKEETDKIKQERDNLRNMVQVLNQKPGRQELRQVQVYQKAIAYIGAAIDGQ